MIYHLALQTDWERTVSQEEIYYPPTYSQDGFTHGTADPIKLLLVANHFYQGSHGDWVCLAMTEAALSDSGVMVKYEPAAPVGDQDGSLKPADHEPAKQSSQALFPHIYGGIAPGAVHAVYPVTRDGSGQFIRIDIPD
jgi:uncharacterized protein (DUF952 family)